MPRTNKRPQRRVNPNKAPWDKYPVLVFHPDEAAIAARDDARRPQLRTLDDFLARDVTPIGDIAVVRGEFDLDADLNPDWLEHMADYPGVEYVVTTDAFGYKRILRAGCLIDAVEADTDPLDTGLLPLVECPASTATTTP